MDERELATREHENFIAYVSGAIQCGRNLVIRHEGGVATLLSGSVMRLFNQILIEDATASPQAIQRGVTAGRERGDPFRVSLRHGTDERFAEAVRAAGLISGGLEEAMPGMAWYPITPAGLRSRAGAELEIRRVTDESGVVDHMKTATAGFGMDESVASDFMCLDLANRDGWSVYVGYVRGEPVCTGLGLQTGSTIGVYNIATVEQARQRGYGQAITARVVADGVANGCDVAILQASGMGRPVYERMGFRVVERYVAWVDPEPTA